MIEYLGFSSESLGFSYETLGFSSDILSFSSEILAFSGDLSDRVQMGALAPICTSSIYIYIYIDIMCVLLVDSD